MTQAQLNRAVAQSTGEDLEVIEQRGFRLVVDEPPLTEADFEALIVDWDRVQSQQATALFSNRQRSRQD